ncbi:MAG: thioredoxin domain-containing protein [Flavobacteriales bacterium]|nr:thioredoxin domain-containing protein [Flavobacteriales bacterium]MBP9079131.1 thioredoxin domain-containing protein [Flavobacteriales bacterium]
MHAHTNRLARETSPYLLQHAHNPVDWQPWGEAAFAKARAENKLVLVSIGYSTCHWCHVMERESFVDEDVARLMNRHLVCIKVDREERPDVDHVYMAAVQLLAQRGGWPLNCFTLPDGRPVHGGTYFPKDQWTRVVEQLAGLWKADPAKLEDYATRLHAGLKQGELIAPNTQGPDFTRDDVDRLAEGFAKGFDTRWGGPEQAPKFPLPNNYEFLLRYALATHHQGMAEQVRRTLANMAQGGIHDQIGGGFSRYSTDIAWKVPHFEKMLYDNAQLISLYSHAYQAFHDEAYRAVVDRIIGWAVREMLAPDGGWYSALDADSEGEEGLFYLWTEEQLEATLGEDAGFARDYYNAGGAGYWEQGRNILLRTMADADYARKHGLTLEELATQRARVDALLMAARDQRPRPGLDHKVLTSWNALMVSALCDAHNAFGGPGNLQRAQQTMRLLLSACKRPDGGLWHNRASGTPAINGYLEDYGFCIEALLSLYQSDFNEQWITEARQLAAYAINHFLDEATGLFLFTSNLDPALITRHTGIHDNVVPASNSSMAKGLFALGHLLDDPELLAISRRQLNQVLPGMQDYPSSFSNWAQVLMDQVHPWYEIAITGPGAIDRLKEFHAHYIPGRLFMGATGPSGLPLLKGKVRKDATSIFVCENKVCQLPVGSVAAALIQMQ